MRVLSVIILLTALILPTVALAEVQTFTATHTYILGDDDSRNTARQKCLAEAKRKILEQVGVYLESKSELITSSQSTTSGSAKSPQTTNEERQQITEQINTLTAGVMRTEVVKEEFGEVNGRLQITLTLKSEVDPDDIRKQLAERRVDQKVRNQVVEQAERLKKLEESLSAMMEEMRTKGGDAPRRPQKQNAMLPTATDIAIIRERANAGDAQAQNLLGNMYVVGKNLPQDYATARQWYEKAADQGNAAAQYNLGALYHNGQGVSRDYATARGWYEKAAAQGFSQAQVNLGVLYYNGLGVSQDNATASQWWEKAANQGHAQAQYKLGLLYSNMSPPAGFGRIFGRGQGSPQDYVRAYMWFSLAVGHLTGDEQKLAPEYRDQVAGLMTPAQIAEAQRLTSQCQARQFKGC